MDTAVRDADGEDGDPTDAESRDGTSLEGANRTGAGTSERTTVEVRCTGHVRRTVGAPRLEFTFTGATLREFLEAFFAAYDVRQYVIAETEAEATTSGWAPAMEELPGENYAKNPEGEQTRRYARVTVDGTFNEHLDGLDTELEDGDRIALMYPFIYCC